MNESAIAREYLETGHCDSCAVVDLHAHFGPFQGIYMPNATPQQMIATMDRCGVERIVSSGHTALADMVRGNQEMAEVTADHPGRWYSYLTVNPNYPALVRRELALFEERRSFVGLKLHPSFHQYPLDGDGYRSALEFASALKLLVLTHTWGGSVFDRPEVLERVARRYPQVTFLAGHSGYGQFEECMAVASVLPNVYLELTAAYAVGGLIERMVDVVGAHKIVFGCDLPWFDPYYAIGCIVMAHISEAARRAILRDNAVRLLAGHMRV